MRKFLIGVLLTSPLAFSALALDTNTDQKTTEENVDKAQRSAKKTLHHAEEGVVCAEGDLKCLEKKAADRGKEGKDYMKDKEDESKSN
jgi:hypothetical protein